MMSFVLVALVGLMVLLPPLSLIIATRKYVIANRELTGIQRAGIAAFALAPLALNLWYMISAAPILATGQIVPDAAMALAVVLSWMSFYARVLMGKRTAKLQRNAI